MNCIMCGIQFEQTQSWQRFCSTKCRVKSFRAKETNLVEGLEKIISSLKDEIEKKRSELAEKDREIAYWKGLAEGRLDNLESRKARSPRRETEYRALTDNQFQNFMKEVKKQ